ncbi:MAG: hypothetical protein NZM38_07615 [Cytophagales bacterium]|nr:hypothetical protein [Cytophagales bacterium]MDW8384623.1 hypothetical protein [Flammeovirgaceae bacterium]
MRTLVSKHRLVWHLAVGFVVLSASLRAQLKPDVGFALISFHFNADDESRKVAVDGSGNV